MIAKGAKPAVIVGFDGTETGRAAVSIAAGEAALRGSRLRIVHAREVVEGTSPAPGIPRGEVDATVMEEATELARLTLPEDLIDVETVHGWALDELLARSVGAEMLVLGRGHPGPMGVLLGSIALGATTRASCPVLVVGAAMMGGSARSEAVVVVGVDGVDDSKIALEEAFAEARLRRARLVAVHTWRPFASSGPADTAPLFRDPLGLDAHHSGALRVILAPFRARFPLVAVTEQIVEGTTARILVEISAQAALLVVGTRGRGPITGLLFGSVGQHVVAHARCPVLVARPRESSDPRAKGTRPTVSRVA
jgi:nucleotide-binding universal stress UspA family protein